jgi:hypothetical protein
VSFPVVKRKEVQEVGGSAASAGVRRVHVILILESGLHLAHEATTDPPGRRIMRQWNVTAFGNGRLSSSEDDSPTALRHHEPPVT